MAVSLNNLAEIYRLQGKYVEAKPLYKRVLKIREKAFGKYHPDVAQSMSNLACLYYAQGKYDKAESHFKRALEIGDFIYLKTI